MKKIIFVLVAILCMLPTTSSASTHNEALFKMIASLQAQILVLQEQLAARISAAPEHTEADAEWKFNYSKTNLKLGLNEEVEYDEDDIVNIFLVNNNRLYKNNRWTKPGDTDDEKIWNLFAEVAGDEFVDNYVTRYATYRFPESGILGFVQFLDEEEPSWGFAFNANASDFNSKKWKRDMASVVLHEYAHILTKNGDQTDYKFRSTYNCKTSYLSNIGCAKKKSYINAFVKEFWSQSDIEASEENREAFYKKNTDKFITEYAAKDPEEDIAESFTQFIVYSKPTGDDINDQKILFFYDYPELVEMRSRIRDIVKEYYID